MLRGCSGRARTGSDGDFSPPRPERHRRPGRLVGAPAHAPRRDAPASSSPIGHALPAASWSLRRWGASRFVPVNLRGGDPLPTRHPKHLRAVAVSSCRSVAHPEFRSGASQRRFHQRGISLGYALSLDRHSGAPNFLFVRSHRAPEAPGRTPLPRLRGLHPSLRAHDLHVGAPWPTLDSVALVCCR